jgi:hypothetical protein
LISTFTLPFPVPESLLSHVNYFSSEDVDSVFVLLREVPNIEGSMDQLASVSCNHNSATFAGTKKGSTDDFVSTVAFPEPLLGNSSICCPLGMRYIACFTEPPESTKFVRSDSHGLITVENTGESTPCTIAPIDDRIVYTGGICTSTTKATSAKSLSESTSAVRRTIGQDVSSHVSEW